MTLNNYKDSVNGWLNKVNYPYGVLFELVSSANDLAIGEWAWNPEGLYESNSIKKEGSKVIELDSKISLNGLLSEGYRRAYYKVWDNAGNLSLIKIIAPLDRTPPKTYYIDIDKTMAEDNLKTPAKKIFKSIEKTGNYTYKTEKYRAGNAIYTSDSCKDYNFGSKKYDIFINNNFRYVAWNLKDTDSPLKETFANTVYKKNQTGDIYNGYRSPLDDRYVIETKYIEVAGNNALVGGSLNKTTYYGRYCVDIAGNPSPYYINSIKHVE